MTNVKVGGKLRHEGALRFREEVEKAVKGRNMIKRCCEGG